MDYLVLFILDNRIQFLLLIVQVAGNYKLAYSIAQHIELDLLHLYLVTFFVIVHLTILRLLILFFGYFFDIAIPAEVDPHEWTGLLILIVPNFLFIFWKISNIRGIEIPQLYDIVF